MVGVINCRDELLPAPNPGGSQLKTMGRLRNSGKVPGALKRDQQSQRTGLLGLVWRQGELRGKPSPDTSGKSFRKPQPALATQRKTLTSGPMT